MQYGEKVFHPQRWFWHSAVPEQQFLPPLPASAAKATNPARFTEAKIFLLEVLSI